MSVRITDVKQLQRAAELVARVEGRAQFPLPNPAALEASGGRLTLAATDLRVWAKVEVTAEGDLAPVAVPAREFARALKGREGEVALEPLPAAVRIVGSDWEETVGVADYWRPERTVLPDVEGEQIVLGRGVLAHLLQVSHAALRSDDDYPPALRYVTVQFSVTGHGVRMVATDRYRLSSAWAALEGEAPAVEPVLVPLHAARIWAAAAGRREAVVTVSPDRSALQVEGVTVVAENVREPYPDWAAVIPDYAWPTAVVDTKPLRQAIASHLKAREPFVRIVAEPGGLRVLGNEKGEEEGVLVEAKVNESARVRLSAVYLDQALRNFGKQTEAYFPKPEGVTLWQPAGRSDLFELIMPVRDY